MTNRMSTLVVAILGAQLGCGNGLHPCKEQKMLTLGDELRRLTAAVQGEVVADPTGTAGISDAQLLARATARDPKLLTPFDRYLVKTHRSGNYISLLVCTTDGQHGLLEDTNCTVALDRQPWRDPTAACQPVIALSEVCQIK